MTFPISEAGARILIVEDEAHLADGLRFNLEAEGYLAQVAESSEAAIELLDAGERFDFFLLDAMLPGMDGFSLATELRRRAHYQPVLMLTARGRPEDIVKGFGAGADDYLPKPFDLTVLFARVGGLLRRAAWVRRPPEVEPEQVALGSRVVDFRAMEVRSREGATPLTLLEANLLRYMIRHAGEAISRARLLEEVWGVREDTDTRAIDNFVVRLRRYIEDEPANPKHLLTVRGVGYRFVIE